MVQVEFINLPELEGASPEQALRRLWQHYRQAFQLLAQVNDEVENLKRKVEDLEFRARFG